MKIKFDKLITDSENIKVQYNQNLSKTSIDIYGTS